MLGEFQQAMADLVASPALCNAVRDDAAVLTTRYRLTEREHQRALAIARHKGMQAACSVYRMNRITPLAINLRATLQALGERLPVLMTRYWQDHPRGHTHFYIESERFCRWLVQCQEDQNPGVAEPLQREWAVVREALAASLSDS